MNQLVKERNEVCEALIRAGLSTTIPECQAIENLNRIIATYGADSMELQQQLEAYGVTKEQVQNRHNEPVDFLCSNWREASSYIPINGEFVKNNSHNLDMNALVKHHDVPNHVIMELPSACRWKFEEAKEKFCPIEYQSPYLQEQYNQLAR